MKAETDLSHRHTLLATLVAASLVAGCGGPTIDPAAKRPAAPAPAKLHNRGVALMGQFDYNGAVEVFEQIAKAASLEESGDARVDLAIALLNRRAGDDLSRAAELLDETRKADPRNLRAAYCRALLYFNEGNNDQALELFRIVAEADPSDGYAIYYVGQCLFGAGQFEEASERFERAAEIDPYLRSAYYGSFQAAQRKRDADGARDALQAFQRLAENPRARLAELKYTRMGPKSEVSAKRVGVSSEPQPPAGPLFDQPKPLSFQANQPVTWRSLQDAGGPSSLIAADLNHDGLTDLFIAGGLVRDDGSYGNAVLARGASGFEPMLDSPLAEVSEVQTALCGDVDDDGLNDIYLLRNGPNQLWRQSEPGVWIDVTEQTSTSGGDFHTVDGALHDLDHDGDLDLLLVNRDGPLQVLNNDRNGGFSSIADQLEIEGDGRAARQVLLTDLDTDDDVDLVVLKEEAPHEVYLNDRLWNYRVAEGFGALKSQVLHAAVAADTDVDGQVEIVTTGPAGLQRWSPNESGAWEPTTITVPDSDAIGQVNALALHDTNGDGALQLHLFSPQRWSVCSIDGGSMETFPVQEASGRYAVLIDDRGPEIVALRSGKAPLHWRAGSGRHAFARLRLSGKTDKAAEMRSNSSGIGVRGVAQIGGRWTPLPETRPHSSPGQGLQPYALGLGGAEKIDFVRLLWPDGVSQTELDLAPNRLHEIPETQRQAGSCPLLFVWDGSRYVFLADMLGAGGIGFNLGKGDYYDPRPKENYLLPEGVLLPREGKMILKLGEPMEEICYFDAVRLIAYDLPPGWGMSLDERFGASEPLPTGEALFYQELISPIAATNDRGEDITERILHRDRRAAALDRQDRRFIGMSDPHSVEITFDRPIDEIDNPVLLFDGWVEYPYSQTAFAAWQAGAEYVEPTIEAQDAQGEWRPVFTRFGYMAGTPRESTVPIPKQNLPPGATRLRISTNMQIYWDRFALFNAAPCPEAVRTPLSLTHAEVADVGFSARTLGDQRYTSYNYDDRPPLDDARHPKGFYTELGNAVELVAEADNALAIIGPGEEVHLEYLAPQSDPPAGWTRRWVVEADGWCKDRDLFTQHAGTVQPVPMRPGGSTHGALQRREELHLKYNTRYRDGW